MDSNAPFGYKFLTICLMTFLIITLILFLFKFIIKLFPSSNQTTSSSPSSPRTGEEVNPVTRCRNVESQIEQPNSTDNLPDIPATSYQVQKNSETEQDSNENCSICLGELSYGDTIRVLPRCKHIFHKECIDQWLPIRSCYCPICRVKAIEQGIKPENVNSINNQHGSSAINDTPTLIFSFGNTVHIPSIL